ncbi:DUF6582 domain-containing protein [Deinococcus sp. QL22]|uniref:DUF6582 domain-containing protein n=1 Tax=Deinococcus sp. QL22 TaxID=2939437 RepID=UPI00201814FD|nr:DUF6582 domain-containing protein [Deinococcus sp. QL22]UQN10745.1 hypothetical protein M1R55_31415 [Deinococcus sp. QL22]UQN10791.1 hypothetical protein M1R55_31165 [Deinococcus sp. QL22]
MAELNDEKRNELGNRDFAYVDQQGERHLPIHDEAHVKNAAARFSQTHFENAAAKQRAARQIVAAAQKHGIELSEDDVVKQAAQH